MLFGLSKYFRPAIAIGAKTDVGKLRKENEDSILINADKRLYAVADGMGGHAGGKDASTIALEVIEQNYELNQETMPEKDKITEFTLDSLADSILRAHRRIKKINDRKERSSRDETLSEDMGTTAVVAALTDDKLCVAHVGDSRAYLISDKKISRLTEDHDLRTQMSRSIREKNLRDTGSGELTEEDMDLVKNLTEGANRLVQAVGIPVSDNVEIDKKAVVLKTGDQFLLCSDGLTRVVNDEEILSAVKKNKDPQDACDKLVKLANERGGPDNISVVVGRKMRSNATKSAITGVALAAFAGAMLGTASQYLDHVSKAEDAEIARANLMSKLATDVPELEPLEEKGNLFDFSTEELSKARLKECREAAFTRFVSLVQRDHPKSRNKDYNLSKDAKSRISVQGVINTAYWFGTRSDNDKSNDYRGGYGNPEQRELANNFVRANLGKGIASLLKEGRANEFTLASMNPEGIDSSKVPACTPVAPKAPEKKGSLDDIDDLQQGNPDDTFTPDSKDASPWEYASVEGSSAEKGHEYTAVQRTVIEHLYKEFAFGKRISESEMSAKAREYSINDLTAADAREVYLDIAASREVAQDNNDDEEIIELTDADIITDDTDDNDAVHLADARNEQLKSQWQLARDSWDNRARDYRNEVLKNQWERSCKERRERDIDRLAA